MSTALVQSFYVGLRSGDFSRTTSCLVHRIRSLPYAEYHVKLVIDVFRRITGAKLGSLGVFGAAQVELLDGRIKEGSYPLPNEGGGKCRISDLGDLGALAGLGFKVRINSSGPAYAFTAASFIRHRYTLRKTETSKAQGTTKELSVKVQRSKQQVFCVCM